MSFSAWVDKWIFQMAHLGWGALIATYVGLLSDPSWGLLAVMVFAAVKEFAFDPLTEDPKLSGGIKGDLEDFFFWTLGGLGGSVALFWTIIHLLRTD